MVHVYVERKRHLASPAAGRRAPHQHPVRVALFERLGDLVCAWNWHDNVLAQDSVRSADHRWARSR